MSFINHNDRISRQQWIHQCFSEEHAIRKKLDFCLCRSDILKSDRIANFLSYFTSHLLSYSSSNSGRSHPSRLQQMSNTPHPWKFEATHLSYSNHFPIIAPSCLLQILRELSSLPTACLTYHDCDWPCLDSIKQALAMLSNGKQSWWLVQCWYEA